ncbi:5'-3' exonuclease H3TH domain-containing protein, partial [Bacteroides uniformis]
AQKLIQEYGSLDGLYENIDQMRKSKRKENLVNEEKIARECKDLATIRRDAPLTIGLDDLKYQGVQTEELIKFYQE